MKIKLNKKGLTEYLIAVAGVVLALFFIGLVLYPKLTHNSSLLDVYSSSNDNDGDGTNDVMDECPCGDQQKWYDATTGTYWCVAGYNKQGCDCADEFAKFARTKAGSKDTKALFQWKTDEETQGEKTAGRCVYKKEEGCAYIIYADEKNIKLKSNDDYCKSIFN